MTCPRCGTVLRGISSRGPGDHRLDPCGCRVSSLTARELAGDDVERGRGVAADGGTDDPEGAYWAQPTPRSKQHVFGDYRDSSSNCGKYRDMAVLSAPKTVVDFENDEFNPETDCKECAEKAGLRDGEGGEA